MSNEDDRELRQKSKDNDRFDGDKTRGEPLHSKDANTRMAGGTAEKNGSGDMADDEITLAGHGPDAAGRDVSKNDRDDAAGSDVDDLAEQLSNGVDDDVARRYARIILRTGGVLSTGTAKAADDDRLDQIAANLSELQAAVEDIVSSLEDENAGLSDRINARAD